MQDIFSMKQAVTRSISPENRTGEPGRGGATPLEMGSARNAARDLGTGWKVNPYLIAQPGETLELAHILGEGKITQMWMTFAATWRNCILRIYWDGSDVPSVECPVGDFFCMGWGRYAQLSSLAVCVNPGSGFNCYWPMPFRRECLITMENIDEKPMTIYYQINYELGKQPDDMAYFHARFSRVNPLPYKQDYVILDGVKGRGQYVGTYLAWGVNNTGWWGEGEIKFFMDGDTQYPTICGTGTEDYIGGSYNFEDPIGHATYRTFTTPYSGLHQVIEPDRLYSSQMRFGMYRWHITDPVRFETDLRVTIQALGWRAGGRYLPLQDDISSVAFWYQDALQTSRPSLPSREYLEVI